MNTILLIEDDPIVCELLEQTLRSEGFLVYVSHTGENIYELLASSRPNLLIMDVTLPYQSGFELCKDIRKHSEVPIIFLTSKTDEFDKVLGLSIGGDDYLTKPFSTRELLARIRVILKRLQSLPVKKNNAPSSGCSGLIIDYKSREIFLNGIKIHFPAKEFELLYYLYQNPNHVLTKEQIYERVWKDPAYGDISTVIVHVNRIRTKLQKADPNWDCLVTIKGVGYKLKGTVKNG